MEIKLVSLHFWILHIIFTLAIIAGLFYRISTILQGSLLEYGDVRINRMSRWKKFWYFIGKFFRTLFSRNFIPIVITIITDSILHVKLLKENKLKWIAHTFIFWGVLALFILSILSGIAVEIAPLFNYQEGTCGFLDALADMDHWATAFLNETLNAIIFLGIIIAFIRGFVTKKKIGMMMFQDIFLIIFILVIILSGWFIEAARYIVERTPTYIGWFGYVGFYLGRLLKLIFPQAAQESWITAYKVFWHLHVSVVWLAFVYIPFSKFAHALLSPVASVINVMEKRKAEQNNH
ncbi:MAG: hypothetical protein JW997_06145 [Actinobacteria bacterium]|nr:hypothetical protein [Actinomycetota bacterium]